MATIYDKVPAEVRKIVKDLVEQHFPDLVEAEVKIDLLFATAEHKDEEGPREPSLKLNGYPCAAIAKITSYENRVKGPGDCSISIDADEETGWPSWSDRRRESLLRHELLHFEIQRYK